MTAIRAFLGYFQIRGSASTVAAKSIHLKTLADHAEMFFSGKDEEMRGRTLTVGQYLLGVSSCQKTETRRAYRGRSGTDDRLSRGVMFLPQDFKRCKDAACRELQGIFETFERTRKDDGGAVAAKRIFSNNPRILQKWSINMLGCLILCGGGQRPQVFSQLQLPDEYELRKLKQGAEHEKYFELRTLAEKTRRTFDMPNVCFPGYLCRYVCLHIEQIRPVIVEDSGIEEKGLLEKTLLLHTRTGEPLSTLQVSTSFRKFLTSIDPELEKVTPMAVRGSFATMMVQEYRKGRIFRGKSESHFLEYLSRSMNTSVEQLTRTYAGCASEDFRESARELTSVMESPNQSTREENISPEQGYGEIDI